MHTRKTKTATPGMERQRQNLKNSMPNLALVRCFVTMLLRSANNRAAQMFNMKKRAHGLGTARVNTSRPGSFSLLCFTCSTDSERARPPSLHLPKRADCKTEEPPRLLRRSRPTRICEFLLWTRASYALVLLASSRCGATPTPASRIHRWLRLVQAGRSPRSSGALKTSLQEGTSCAEMNVAWIDIQSHTYKFVGAIQKLPGTVRSTELLMVLCLVGPTGPLVPSSEVQSTKYLVLEGTKHKIAWCLQ